MSWEQFEHDVLACIADSNDNTKMVATATQAYTEELQIGRAHV